MPHLVTLMCRGATSFDRRATPTRVQAPIVLLALGVAQWLSAGETACAARCPTRRYRGRNFGRRGPWVTRGSRTKGNLIEGCLPHGSGLGLRNEPLAAAHGTLQLERRAILDTRPQHVCLHRRRPVGDGGHT